MPLKNNTIIMIIVMTVFATITACDHKYNRRLSIADSMISDNTGKAIILLEQIKDSIDTSDKQERMLWNLLRVKADVYEYRSFTSDSLIRPAMEYYEKHNEDKNTLAQAYYYAGKVYVSLNDYPQATDCFLKAITTIPKNDINLRGRTYNQLGYIYSDQWLDMDALSMFQKADSCYKASNDEESLIYTRRDIADLYAGWNKMDSAMIYLKQALAIAKHIQNDALIAGISAQIAGVYAKMGRFLSAKQYLKTALDYNDPHDQSALLSIAARVYLGLGETEKAMAYYGKIIDIGTIYAKRHAHKELADFYVKRNDTNKALHHIKLYAECTDSVSSITATEAVKQKNNYYSYSLKEKENALIKEENNRKTVIITILFATVITIITIFVSTVRHLQQKKKIQQFKLEKYETLLSHIEETKAQPQFSHTPKNDFESSNIGKRLKQLRNNPTAKVRLNDNEWVLLDETINAYHPDFSKNVTDLCKMSLHDYRICLLLKAKQPLKFICEIMSIGYSGLNSVRCKLYKRAFEKKGTANDWDKVIDSL